MTKQNGGVVAGKTTLRKQCLTFIAQNMKNKSTNVYNSEMVARQRSSMPRSMISNTEVAGLQRGAVP